MPTCGSNQIAGFGEFLLLANLGCMQTDATLLDVTCCVRLHTLLDVVAQSLKPAVKLLSQQLPTYLLFRDH